MTIGTLNGRKYFPWFPQEEAQEQIAEQAAYEVYVNFPMTPAELDALNKAVDMILDDPAHIAVSACAELPQPRYILSRSWTDKHLNSDDDLKFFSGGAVIR